MCSWQINDDDNDVSFQCPKKFPTYLKMLLQRRKG